MTRDHTQAMVDEIERLRDALTMIHEITQDANVPAWQALQNVAATASSALSSQLRHTEGK